MVFNTSKIILGEFDILGLKTEARDPIDIHKTSKHRHAEGHANLKCWAAFLTSGSMHGLKIFVTNIDYIKTNISITIEISTQYRLHYRQDLW